MTAVEGTFDVVVCGSGMAGLCVARQLRLRHPNLRVAAVDRLRRPLPTAAFKVGESTVDPGGKYLADVLELRDYLEEHQLDKFGFRFFFARPGRPFAERPEMGRSVFTPVVAEYQLDRGVLENDLRERNQGLGVELFEGAELLSVQLGEAGADHIVEIEDADGGRRGLRCRWVVDATGRRRFLQRKLALIKPCASESHSAAWFRVPGLVDVSDFVPRSEAAWHARVPGSHPHDPSYGRRNSTVHLVGDGYWVWIILLASGHTSIGIVSAEPACPFDGYNTRERALAFLQQREPELAGAIADRALMDFRTMRHYSYGSRQVLSADRWACVGEAAVFSDPYYANGCDLLGFAASMTCEAIGLDFAGRFNAELAAGFNHLFLRHFEVNTESLHGAYALFGQPSLTALKFAWDGLWFFAFHAFCTYGYAYRHRLHELCEDPRALAGFERLHAIRAGMTHFFAQWAQLGAPQRRFTWIDYFRDLPFSAEIGLDALRPRFSGEGREPEDPAARLQRHLQVCEEAGNALFALAGKTHLPQLTPAARPGWIDLRAIDLDPAAWTSGSVSQSPPPGYDSGRCLVQLEGLFDPEPVAHATLEPVGVTRP